jgi:hypothetical protein
LIVDGGQLDALVAASLSAGVLKTAFRAAARVARWWPENENFSFMMTPRASPARLNNTINLRGKILQPDLFSKCS